MARSFVIIPVLILFSLVNVVAMAASGDKGFQYPLKISCKLERGFGAYVDSGLYTGKYHNAQDCAGDGGTPVYAVADGVIGFSAPAEGYGWLIVIDHPFADVYSLYGHISTRRWKMISGNVKYGELIGFLADDDEDGGSHKPHLHFSIRKGQKTDYPASGDDRWSAGYTYEYPTKYGWVHPFDFIEDHKQDYQSLVPAPPVEFR